MREAATPAAPAAAPALALRDVSAGYGPFRALFGVSVEVGRGEAVALLGANGVGKTTVARVATGLIRPSGGSVAVGGEDFTGRRTYEFARAGVSHAPEGRSVFATLTVEENLTLSLRRRHRRADVGAALDLGFEMFPALAGRRHQAAGTLSGGEQRMLSMARVLIESPRALVADELSLGLAPMIIDEVYESLERLRGEGISLLIIEQQVGHALQLCGRVVLLGHGAVAWQGSSAEAVAQVAGLFEPS